MCWLIWISTRHTGERFYGVKVNIQLYHYRCNTTTKSRVKLVYYLTVSVTFHFHIRSFYYNFKENNKVFSGRCSWKARRHIFACHGLYSFDNYGVFKNDNFLTSFTLRKPISNKNVMPMLHLKFRFAFQLAFPKEICIFTLRVWKI